MDKGRRKSMNKKERAEREKVKKSWNDSERKGAREGN